jgi:hypothetical protein
LSRYPLVDSACAHADFGSGEMVLRNGDEVYELWFNQLGAMGCIPAYDRFFKTGVGPLADFPAQFGKSSYAGLIRFYKKNKDSIDAAESEIAERGMKYPAMKLIDMYFWNLGYVVTGVDN